MIQTDIIQFLFPEIDFNTSINLIHKKDHSVEDFIKNLKKCILNPFFLKLNLFNLTLKFGSIVSNYVN